MESKQSTARRNVLLFCFSLATSFFLARLMSGEAEYVTPVSSIQLAKVASETGAAATPPTAKCEARDNDHTEETVDINPAELIGQVSTLDPKSIAFIKAVTLLEGLSADELISLLQSEVPSEDPDGSEYALRYNAALYLSRQYPGRAYEQLNSLPEEILMSVGLTLLSGLIAVKPLFAWNWIESNIDKKGANLNIQPAQFNQVKEHALVELAKVEGGSIHAFNLAKKHLSNELDAHSFAIIEIAKIATRADEVQALEYLEKTIQSGRTDENFFNGYVQHLLSQDLYAVTDFIKKHQNNVPFLASSTIADRFVAEGSVDSLKDMISQLDNQETIKSLANNAAQKLLHSNLNDSIAMLKLVENQETRLESVASLEIAMRYKQFDFQEHMRIYEKSIDDKALYLKSFRFASTLHSWSDKEPQSVAAYIDTILAGDQEIAEEFQKNYDYAIQFSQK